MNSSIRTAAILLLAVVAAALEAAPAAAIPSFARKYGVSCSLCHDPAPRLTAFGDQFAANGFEMRVGEEARDTVDTGDDLLRLLRRIDLSFRFDAYVAAADPIGGTGSRMDLQTPYNIKILSGGPIAEKVSYYMYFFLTERGEVAGLEDAYIQFSDIAGAGASLIAGQFQVSDPMFKRELRLPYEDYQLYRVRVGHARPDLTYDRGFFASYEPWSGSALSLMLVNGTGIGHAGVDRLYDQDPFKNVAAHLSQELGPVRLGAFAYRGVERAGGFRDRILIFGPDATVEVAEGVEVNLQFLRRDDTNPLLGETPLATRVDSFLGELVVRPFGANSRWYLTGLYNWIDADRPLLSLRIGEQATPEGYLQRYHSASIGAHYLLQRNVRLLAEGGWDVERGRPRGAIGTTLAW
jgi:hypothetical protein